jgi:hypothetical protein
MIRIEQLTVTVTVEGEADAGERAFARLFDKFSQLRDQRLAARQQQAGSMSRARSLSPRGGRN